jgi:hypothetical protein
MASFSSISHESRIDFLARLAKARMNERNAVRLREKAEKAVGDSCPYFRLNQRLFERAHGPA